MKRGDIFLARLDPAVGSEIAKTRPVLIVSNDRNNAAAQTVTILPISSRAKRQYSFHVAIEPKESGLPKPSTIKAEQIRTISKQRLMNRIGTLPSQIMEQVNAAIKLHLSLV